MGHPRSSPEGFGFGEHGFFSDGEEEGVAEFEAGVAFGVGREGADPEVLAADDDGAAGVAVAVEEVVAVAVEIEGGIAEGGEVDASFNADAVLVGGEGELNGAVAAGEEVVAGGGPGGGPACGAALATPAINNIATAKMTFFMIESPSARPCGQGI